MTTINTNATTATATATATDVNTIVPDSVALCNKLNELRAARIKADKTVFRKANHTLYKMLFVIYNEYNAIVDDKEEKKAFIEYYKKLSASDAKTYPAFKSNSPNLIDVMTRYVFSDSDVRIKRVTAYARVLRYLVTLPAFETAKAFVAFLDDNGGIEEVSAMTSNTAHKETKKAEREQFVADLKENFTTVVSEVTDTVKVEDAAQYASELTDKHVVLLGVMNADGSITVKHMCAEDKFGKREKDYGSNVVQSAIANFASVTKKKISDDNPVEKLFNAAAAANDATATDIAVEEALAVNQ